MRPRAGEILSSPGFPPKSTRRSTGPIGGTTRVRAEFPVLGASQVAPALPVPPRRRRLKEPARPPLPDLRLAVAR
eukprot:8754444-Alexandrium_andersonii.AAC.1